MVKHIGEFEEIPNFGVHFVTVASDDREPILLNIDNIQYIDVEQNCVEMGDTFIELDAKSMKKLCDLLGMGATDLC